MLKITKYLLFTLLMFLIIIPTTNAKEKVSLYLFWGDGCPHCAAEKEYLVKLQKEYPELEIKKYEVWNNKENADFLQEIADKTNQNLRGVPITIIGGTIINGFSPATEKELKRTVAYYSENKHQDIVAEIKLGTYKKTKEIPDAEFKKQEKKLDKNTTVTLPIVGDINFKNHDLITVIPILGILASLSLSTIWLILAFLSSIKMQSNKKSQVRSLILGMIAFAITSVFFQKIEKAEVAIMTKIIILFLCTTLSIMKIKKIEIPSYLSLITSIIFAIAIGFTTNSNYLNIVSTLIEINNTSKVIEIIIKISYLFSYIIPYILLLFLYHVGLKKVSIKYQEIIPLSIVIATILITIFI